MRSVSYKWKSPELAGSLSPSPISPLSLCLCHVRTQQEDGCLQTRRRALTRTQSSGHPNLGLPSLQNYEKLISVVKAPLKKNPFPADRLVTPPAIAFHLP